MMRPLLRCSALLSILIASAPSFAQDYVYWAGNSGIARATQDGATVDPAFIPIAAGWVTGVAVSDQHVFWANPSSDTIGRANLDGTGVNQNFITGARDPYGVVVDGSYVYWANYDSNSIGRANLDGTGVTQSFISGVTRPHGLVAHGSYLYWASYATNAISRANLDGTGVNASFLTGLGGPRGIAVVGPHLYWTSYQNRTIGRANLDGSDANQSFVSVGSNPVYLSSNGEALFWTEYTGNIGRVNLDGTGADLNYLSATSPFGIAASLASPPPADAQYVYWANSNAGTIGRSNPDGTGAAQRFINVGAFFAGVAADQKYIYWTDINRGFVGRANLDGSAVDPDFITGGDQPYGIVVDDQFIYWANFNGNTISRANLDGTGVQTLIGGANGPVTIAVNGQHIYWTNFGSNTIGRANLDGSGVNQSFTGGGQRPSGLTIDGQFIYWTSQLDAVGRANLDGSGSNPFFIPGASIPAGVAVDGQHIYWTNNVGNTIGRANLDGTNATQSFITGAVRPYGIALSAPPSPFQVRGTEGWRTLALPKAGITLGGRGPGYLAPIHTAGYVGADADQRNRRGTANVFLYDEPTAALVPPRREDSVASGDGFWVYVREDDVPYGQSGVQGGFPKTLDASGGTSVTGAHTFSLSYSAGSPFPGVNLVGNPYDEAIDWDDASWTKADVGSTVYVWDPAYNGGDYRTWDGSTGDLAGGVIPAGQGFHVEALSESAALTVTEAAKTGEPGILNGLGASGETVASSKATGDVRGLSFRLSGTVGTVQRESRAWVSLAPEAALGLDARDGRRLAGASGADALRLYTLAPEGEALAIAALPSDAEGEIALPLHAEALDSGEAADARAVLAWDAARLPDGWMASLRDRETGKSHSLTASGEIALVLTPASALTASGLDRAAKRSTDPLAPPPVPQARPLSVAADKASGARFTLVLTPGAGVTPEAQAFAVGEIGPNPASGAAQVSVSLAEAGEVTLAVYDALGRRVAETQEVMTSGSHRVSVPVAGLAPGTYVVRVEASGGAATRRMTVVR